MVETKGNSESLRHSELNMNHQETVQAILQGPLPAILYHFFIKCDYISV